MKTNSIQNLGCSVLLALAAATSQAVTIDMVTVCDPGNPADPSDGDNQTPGVQNLGAVSYTYAIGKYEVTNEEYTGFLNAVADDDPNELYNTAMSSHPNGGIERTGSSGSYVYTVKAGRGNNPVVFVGALNAMRFVNWLENGQPTGAQGAGTTEAGVYTIGTGLDETRASGTSFWLPSADEWYKAAYYQPAAMGGPSDSYWLYPMRTDSAPYSAQPPGTSSPCASRAGNIQQDDGVANGYDDGYAVTGVNVFDSAQNYLTDVGAYTTASSYYGTFDQGGNVNEINEAVVFSTRAVRGGMWSFHEANLRATNVGTEDPLTESDRGGFRVAGVSAVPCVVTPPAGITCPANLTLACSTAALVTATYEPTVVNDCDPSPVVVCAPPSGSGFPAGVTTVHCTASDSSGETNDCSFTVTRAALNFTGFHSPIGGADATGGTFADPLRAFKLKSTVPIKMTLDCGGAPVTTGVHTLQVIKFSSATDSDVPLDATPTDAATTGNAFRLTGSTWHYNLDTKATGMSKGTWQLKATLSDGSVHTAFISLK